MKTKIEIALAIAALEKNLDDHVVELEDATEIWIKDAVEALNEHCRALDREGVKASQYKLWSVLNAKPEDNRLQYAKFLGMLKRAEESHETHIECDEDDYDCIFQDNWSWRRASKERNTPYASRRRVTR